MTGLHITPDGDNCDNNDDDNNGDNCTHLNH